MILERIGWVATKSSKLLGLKDVRWIVSCTELSICVERRLEHTLNILDVLLVQRRCDDLECSSIFQILLPRIPLCRCFLRLDLCDGSLWPAIIPHFCQPPIILLSHILEIGFPETSDFNFDRGLIVLDRVFNRRSSKGNFRDAVMSLSEVKIEVKGGLSRRGTIIILREGVQAGRFKEPVPIFVAGWLSLTIRIETIKWPPVSFAWSVLHLRCVD